MMRAPGEDELRPIAEGLGLMLSDGDLQAMTGLLAGLWGSFSLLDEIAGRELAGPGDGPGTGREWWAPPAAENPYGAWQCRTEIRTAGEGPLAGRRIAVKDNIGVAGVPMDNGSAMIRGFVPDRDATVVDRVLAAGGTIAGKAVCEDLCMASTSDTAVTGPVANPWDPAFSAGGSSSGCGALLAAGDVDMAIGADQGGSIRMPAAWCGVVGLKPSYGLVPYTGAMSLDLPIDHLGPMARTVRDVALLLEVLAGPDGLDQRQWQGLRGQAYTEALTGDLRGVRVGIVREGFGIDGESDPDIDAGVWRSLERMRAAGARLQDVSIPEHRLAAAILPATMLIGTTHQLLYGNGAGLNHRGPYDLTMMRAVLDGRRSRAGALSPGVKMALLGGSYLLARDGGMAYATAQQITPWLRAGYDRALAGVDVLAMPTRPIGPVRHTDPDAPVAVRIAASMAGTANTPQLNVAGHPAISVPAGRVNGLPNGMMLIGPHGGDATVLRVAHAWEELTNGFPQPARDNAAGNAAVR
jgi:amidase